MAGLVGIISLIAIIVSGVSLTRPGIPKLTIREMNGLPTGGNTASSSTGHAGVPGTNTNAKIWTIAVGHDYGAHEYRYSIFYKYMKVVTASYMQIYIGRLQRYLEMYLDNVHHKTQSHLYHSSGLLKKDDTNHRSVLSSCMNSFGMKWKFIRQKSRNYIAICSRLEARKS